MGHDLYTINFYIHDIFPACSLYESSFSQSSTSKENPTIFRKNFLFLTDRINIELRPENSTSPSNTCDM